MSIEAQLIGGPHDGQIISMPDLRQRWRMPAPTRAEYWLLSHEGTDPLGEVVPIADYDLMFTNGHPAINDAGQYRFRFAGYE